MVPDRRFLLATATAMLLAACGGTTTSSAPPAAKVQTPVQEAALTTVTLTPEAEKRLGIQTVVVERRALPRTRTVGGEVMAPPGSEMVVTAPFAGTLEAGTTLPTAGTSVAPGQTIFRLVPLAPAERDARVDAQRAVGEAMARHEAATLKRRRAEQLARDGAGSRRAVEEAQTELSVADADLKAARDRLALADRGRADSGGIAIGAPYPAMIRNLHASPGQTVAASAPLFDLVRLDPVWIRVPLYVGESNDIDPRAPVRIVGLGDSPDAEGMLAQPVPSPPPSADPSTAAIDAYYSLSNRDHLLRPGQRVGVRLLQRGEAASLVVPRAALLHDAYGGTWVYVAREPHVFVRQRVTVVDLVDALASLDRGPSPGARVVTDGAAELFGTEFGAGK